MVRTISGNSRHKKVGLIMAGNLPLVGFADWLTIFISGHYAIVKCSEKDNILFPAIIERLAILDNETAKFTSIVEQLKDLMLSSPQEATTRHSTLKVILKMFLTSSAKTEQVSQS
jgi:hypothetical protein